jgi:hypothetical protein
MNMPNGTITSYSGLTLVSSAPMLDTSSQQISSTIEDRRMDELPLNMRQPTELAKLAPGAAPT